MGKTQQAIDSPMAPGIAGYLPKKGDPSPAERAAGKDRHGYTLAERVEHQGAQLHLLAAVVKPEVYRKLANYCTKQNKEANPAEAWPGGVHNVPCGMELYQWLLKHAKLLREQEEE